MIILSDKIDSTIYLSSSTRNHELTMLYLKNQNLKGLSVSEIAQKYTDTKNKFDKSFKEQQKNTTTWV